MLIDQQKSQYCADLVTTLVVSKYAKEHSILQIDALRKIMETKTYSVLQDLESRLCFESAESVMDLIHAEEQGDWEEWIKV